MTVASPARASAPPAWRRYAPLILAALLIAWVISRLDLALVASALGRVNYVGFIAFTIVFNVAMLAADSFATAYVYRATVCPVTWSEIFAVRAASYLPSMLNHHVGQAWLTWFISRAYNAPLWRVAGATLLVYATILGSLVLIGAAAIPAQVGKMPWLAPTVGILAALGVAYLVAIALRPRALANSQTTAPLVEVGVRGHLVALAHRFPHIAVQFVGAWLPFAFFGVHIPFTDALALVPPLMVVVALPITPQGVGTRDLLSIQLFAGYATGTLDERTAAVAAATASWAVVITIVQLVIAPLFMRRAYALMGRGETKDHTVAADSG